MATKALRLVESIARPQLPKNTKLFDAHFRPISSIGALGLFQHQKNIDASNVIFSDSNATEKSLKDEKDALVREVGNEIDWTYYMENVEDKKFVTEAKALYDNIFNSSKLPTVAVMNNQVGGANSEEIHVDSDFEQLIVGRIKELQLSVEHEINPLLNPFADFWTYELDGPEFADVFAARPQWNEILNTAADEHAFHFLREDPTNAETAAIYTDQIANTLNAFKPQSSQFELVKEIASGRISSMLNDTFALNYVAKTERALLEEYTHEDRAGYALRNTYVSQEVDPNGHHFTGH